MVFCESSFLVLKKIINVSNQSFHNLFTISITYVTKFNKIV